MDTTSCTYFAPTQASVSDLTAREAESCGALKIVQKPGGVSFEGSLETGYRFCLWSRTASRLLLSLSSSLGVGNTSGVYDLAHAIPWEEHMHRGSTFAVQCTSRGAPWVKHTHAVGLVVKDALADRLREAWGERPDVDTKSPDLLIYLHIDDDHAEISLDMAGESLHRRGYLKRSSPVSLKEHLAASLLLRSGWDGLGGPDAPFIDPFCGSGILPIEAALIAADAAPGLMDRDKFSFLSWMHHDPVIWRTLIKEAEERRHQGLSQLPLIAAWDNDPKALDAARANIQVAGLKGKVMVQFKDALRLRSTDLDIFRGKRGFLVTDMPYGKRTGRDIDLPELYRGFGSTLTAHFAGWNVSVFTQDPDLLASLGLKPTRTNSFYNGPLSCILGRYEIFDLHTRRKLAEKHEQREQDQRDTPLSSGAQMFANRLMKNWKNLRKYLKEQGITSYRIYDADMPEYNAAIDIYEGTWAHLQEYAPPKTVDPEAAKRRLQEMIDGIAQVTGIEYRRIHVKTREKQKGSSQYTKLSDERHRVIMQEGNLRFYITLTDYLDTGIFLDHRITRSMVREMSQGKRFLNLFGYTGTATVYAAAGGAVQTRTVDMSQTYLQWAQENMRLNGFLGPVHRFEREDVFTWLKKNTSQYDLIFLDPPTFSNSKMVKGTLDIQRDHTALITLASQSLSADGMILFSTNFRKFVLDEAVLKQYHVREITDETIPEDFSDRKIHACWLISKKRTVRVRKR